MSSQPVQIRLISESDLPACLDVIRRSFATVAVEFGLTETNCPSNGAFMALERLRKDYRQGNQMFACLDAETVVGFAQLVRKQAGEFELAKLAVLPEYRHHGCGSRLLDFACAKARELGGQVMTIGIIEENTRLREWYARNGFIHAGTRVYPNLPFTVGFMKRSISGNLIIAIREHPEYAERGIDYFAAKWGIPRHEYERSINDCLQTAAMLPRWYLMLDADDRIIGSYGLIQNDFVDRTDLFPYLCALYVEADRRGRSLGAELLRHGRQEAADLGFARVYLCTDHIGYYEKYGWIHIGTGHHPGGDTSRIYEAPVK